MLKVSATFLAPIKTSRFSSQLINDNTDTYTAATTDAINYQVVTASAGTSMKIAFIAVRVFVLTGTVSPFTFFHVKVIVAPTTAEPVSVFKVPENSHSS